MSPTADELLDALDPEQRDVALALRGPVCVLAGAGTGKTRAITHRIAYGVASGVFKPTEVLAVTFTNRAAGEMRGRLRALGADGVQARTFHSAALRQARYFWPKVYGGELPELTASKIPMLSEAVRRCRVDADSALLRDLAAEVEWAKVSNVRPDDYVRLAPEFARSVAGLDAATTARVFGAYEQVKRDRGRIDMEDILLCTAAILTDDAGVAAQVRAQYRWLVVDEFQDVNPLQSALLDLWLGDRDDICVVGDPLQTIYSFAGASPDYLTGFGRRHPSAQTIELTRNYRSTPQIVAAANSVFATRARREGVVLRAQCDDGPQVEYAGHPDEVAEAEAIAERIDKLHTAGTPLREMAVLFRINAQSEAYEEALASREIPYVVRGVERFFERAEVKQAITLLRGAARAGGEESGELVADVVAILSAMGYTAQAPATAGSVRDRWESLNAVVTMAIEYAESATDAGLTELVADLERRAQTAHAPVAEGVTLATLHSAKGLEWDAVFCVGVHEGTMPITYAEAPQEIEEERRLFYVGMTRARHLLAISWSAARAPGGRGGRRPSRFLDPLLPRDAAAQSRVSRTTRKSRSERRGVARCRSCNGLLDSAAERKIGRCSQCPPTYDEELFEELRTWRLERAAAQKVPAFCVFTDATLVAIAESLPAESVALARIPGIGKTKIDRFGDDVLAIIKKSAKNPEK
ncbi:ATP-dependent DNA helicase UvrD2 [Solicola gregarius]|uniref:DNA 3'-5' helicase n=1 Tax=Solicola gregarius TaxID=2908642 RepID=A0AA46TIR5_9ACTN|nr:ATP-dependent DNA helicase UvrD2 [Solicola gregarius]UYM06097.1 ATP-dependent DNA helicase UvrD2 [Solicola gregarius]